MMQWLKTAYVEPQIVGFMSSHKPWFSKDNELLYLSWIDPCILMNKSTNRDYTWPVIAVLPFGLCVRQSWRPQSHDAEHHEMLLGSFSLTSLIKIVASLNTVCCYLLWRSSNLNVYDRSMKSSTTWWRPIKSYVAWVSVVLSIHSLCFKGAVPSSVLRSRTTELYAQCGLQQQCRRGSRAHICIDRQWHFVSSHTAPEKRFPTKASKRRNRRCVSAF